MITSNLAVFTFMPEISDNDSAVLTEQKQKLEKPGLFKVILHNDDFTTMEFVVFILMHVFKRTENESFEIMLKVHNEGIGVAGVYPYDIAYMKSQKAMNLAKANQYPLLVTIEAE